MLERRVVASSPVDDLRPAQVRRAFLEVLEDGAELVCVGSARRRPRRLLELGYAPRARVRLFDTAFWLSGMRQNTDIRFFVAYVDQPAARGRRRRIHPRLFYKDVSLIWRSASHWVRSQNENWIGKGDLETILENGEPAVYSNEVTTDLPLEIQTALEDLCRATPRVREDDRAVGLVLRRGPDDRLAPYRDFTDPRRRAERDLRNLIHRGKSIARFTRRGDPESLRIVAGFEPDFDDGVVERSHSSSRLYGGPLQRFRIVSRNREVQYFFFAGPRQVWIGSCQATTSELSSYGVRTVDAVVDDELLLPAYEYHFMDDSTDPPELYTQVPAGFAGPASELDPSRVDTSAWLDRMPVIREFRRRVLARRR